MAIETVVFDLGGTLIEYAGSYTTWPELETPGFAAAYAYLQQQRSPMSAFDNFRQAGFMLLPAMWQAAIRHERNLRVVDLLDATLMEIGAHQVLAADVAAAATLYGAAIQAQAAVVQQAVETVLQVKSAGYKVGLVSNTMFPGTLHQADMDRFGLTPYFDEMVFSADVNKWKPNADPFHHLLTALGANADTAVYVGDDPASDVVGGQTAGMRTVYFKSSDRFSAPAGVLADAEIDGLGELLPLLSRM